MYQLTCHSLIVYDIAKDEIEVFESEAHFHRWLEKNHPEFKNASWNESSFANRFTVYTKETFKIMMQQEHKNFQ